MKKNINRRLAAGKPGTKRMVEKYGERLICVRYKYDIGKKIHYKTVELIEEQGFWDIEAKKQKEDKKVGIRVDFTEVELRAKVKGAGGIWDKDKKVWILMYKEVKALGLMDRVVGYEECQGNKK